MKNPRPPKGARRPVTRIEAPSPHVPPPPPQRHAQAPEEQQQPEPRPSALNPRVDTRQTAIGGVASTPMQSDRQYIPAYLGGTRE